MGTQQPFVYTHNNQTGEERKGKFFLLFWSYFVSFLYYTLTSLLCWWLRIKQGRKEKVFSFFLFFLLCFILTLYPNSLLLLTSLLLWWLQIKQGRGGWQGRTRRLSGGRWQGRALGRVEEHGHVAEAVTDEVLASTASGSQGCVSDNHHTFSSW